MAVGEDILKRHEELVELRRPEEPKWRDLARLLTPDEQEFEPNSTVDDDGAELFDATPLYALDNFVGGMYGQLVNPANRWMALGLDGGDPDLAKWGPVKSWFRAAEDVIFASLSPSRSGFYAEAPAWLANVGAFGWGPFNQEEDIGAGRIIDRSLPIGQFYLDVDQNGDNDTMHRAFTLRGRQVKRMFDSRYVPSTCRDDHSYLIVHAVRRNTQMAPGRLGPEGKPWLSSYVSRDLKDFRVDGGYWEAPYHIPTWKRRAGQIYARGPGHLVRADAAMLQEMARTELVAAQRAAEPPLLLHDDSVLTAADIVPNAVLYGTISDNGKQLAQELRSGSNLQPAQESADRRREAIRTAFYYSIMQLVNRPQMTATEFLGFQGENLRLMGPNLVRLQTGGLSPFIARRFAILDRAGQIPPAPPELQGRPLGVEYISPLAKALKADQGREVLQAQQSIEQMAVTDPGVRDYFDGDAAAPIVMEAFTSLPIIRDRKSVDAIRQNRMKQQAAAAQLEAAGKAAEIAATTAHAEQASTLARGRGPA